MYLTLKHYETVVVGAAKIINNTVLLNLFG